MRASLSDGTQQDGTAAVAYSSSDANVLTISATGQVTPLRSGQATVTATYPSMTVTPVSLALNVVNSAPSGMSLWDAAGGFVAAGGTDRLWVMENFANGSTVDISGAAQYQSSAPGIVNVDATGLAWALAPGTATVSVAFAGFTQTYGFTVTAATLSSITVADASHAALAAGTSDLLWAQGLYSDGSQQDLSASVTWTSGNRPVATIDPSGKARARTPGTVQFTAQAGGISGSLAVQVSSASLTALALTDSNAGSMAVGTRNALKALGTFSDQSSQDLSQTLAWQVDNANVASIEPSGRLTAHQAGTVVVTATGSPTVHQSLSIAVTAAQLTSLAVTDAAGGSLPVGFRDRFTAVGTFSDSSTQDLTRQASWAVSDPTLAQVDAAGGLTAFAAGSLTVTASLAGVSSPAQALSLVSTALASLAITDAAAGQPLTVGATDALTVTGTFGNAATLDLTAQVGYSVAPPRWPRWIPMVLSPP